MTVRQKWLLLGLVPHFFDFSTLSKKTSIAFEFDNKLLDWVLKLKNDDGTMAFKAHKKESIFMSF